MADTMLEYDGKTLTTPRERVELLKYWIEERSKILCLRSEGYEKPWSQDHIFQTTYFCNVCREDDKVTKFIREMYSPYVNDPMFEVNIVFSRLINWPETLAYVGYISDGMLEGYSSTFPDIEGKLSTKEGKVFGDAYIVSTNGRALPKAQYVTDMLLPAAYKALGPASGWRGTHGSGSLAAAYKSLRTVYGLGSFMCGQIIADLKNTVSHPLYSAEDWMTWATPGPGSQRGLNWIFSGEANPGRKEWADFIPTLNTVRGWLIDAGCELVKQICNQDLQNCLCEFDKYCRVLTGTGRSKRGYQGV